MKQVRFINEWKNQTKHNFFAHMYINIFASVGNVGIFGFAVNPSLAGTTYIGVVVLGFGFSLLVGTPRNKAGIFR